MSRLFRAGNTGARRVAGPSLLAVRAGPRSGPTLAVMVRDVEPPSQERTRGETPEGSIDGGGQSIPCRWRRRTACSKLSIFRCAPTLVWFQNAVRGAAVYLCAYGARCTWAYARHVDRAYVEGFAAALL